MKRLIPLLLALTLAAPALAVMPDERLADPALEARAREISKELRCLVCQNQSIDDSNAPLARDLRVLVRERLTAGDSNEEALDYIHARYGDFVLLRPPVKPETWALWFGPAVVLVLAGAGSAFYLHRRRREVETTAAAPLTADEERRLEAMMAGGDDENNRGHAGNTGDTARL
ncbi:cytochrome c-type biogenesis protein [Indioceanicola profundi]|uniref:cytochrome c-type biogenesis protein n=1 Tax=Indioceanicola profundi TaxID=2220096 RepID=UPI000E6AD549|nr:cytochrome c-type biogenesis protein [Indioceanicola profundi]